MKKIFWICVSIFFLMTLGILAWVKSSALTQPFAKPVIISYFVVLVGLLLMIFFFAGKNMIRKTKEKGIGEVLKNFFIHMVIVFGLFIIIRTIGKRNIDIGSTLFTAFLLSLLEEARESFF